VDGIAYSLVYKLAKSFEATCLKIEGCKGFIGQITEIVVNFIKHTFSSVKASELQIHGDTSGSKKDKSLYTNLILCNIFMQTAVKDTNLKIKGSPLGLAAST
jgi:two-component sensor histidine kinase